MARGRGWEHAGPHPPSQSADSHGVAVSGCRAGRGAGERRRTKWGPQPRVPQGWRPRPLLSDGVTGLDPHVLLSV